MWELVLGLHADPEALDFCTAIRGGSHILRKLMNSSDSPSFVTISIILVVGARENETGKERKLLQRYVIKLLTIVGW